ncbi:MAG: heavy metal-responsive transcriptional regulator [Vulcanimicrobiaceae bacterium]
MRIGELAARAGVTQKAVRYYERCGLLNPGRTASGYRDFDERELLVVRAIRQSQSLGLHAKDLRDVVDHVARGTAPCTTVRALIVEQRAEVGRKIEELRAFDAMLAALERTQSSSGSEECAILARVESQKRS